MTTAAELIEQATSLLAQAVAHNLDGLDDDALCGVVGGIEHAGRLIDTKRARAVPPRSKSGRTTRWVAKAWRVVRGTFAAPTCSRPSRGRRLPKSRAASVSGGTFACARRCPAFRCPPRSLRSPRP
jgi:hypothetical protein